MRKNNKFILVTSILVALIFITFLVSLNMGSLQIKPFDVIKTLIGQGSKAQEIAIFKLRLPRVFNLGGYLNRDGPGDVAVAA